MNTDALRLFQSSGSPNSRRVRIYLAEKGICAALVPVDLGAKEQFSAAYATINPRLVVPTLVLGDGTAIGEVPAIWRYLEEAYPEPPLLGATPKEKALVTMWERRVELEGCASVMEAVRNAAAGLKGRAIAGPHSYEQIPALVERSKMRVTNFYADLDDRLRSSTFCCRRPLLSCRHHRVRHDRIRQCRPRRTRPRRPCSHAPLARRRF